MANLNTEKEEVIQRVFIGCSSLTSLDVSSFNTKSARTMLGMFRGCTNLEKIDVSNFNTPKIRNIENMFRDCKKLTSIDLSSFQTKHVLRISGIFSGCESSRYKLNITNARHLVDLEYLFFNCKSLYSIDVSKFNTRDIISMKKMFYGVALL